MYIGKPEVAASIAKSELFMVESEQVKQRRVEVMNMDAVHFGAEAEFVGHTVDRSAFDAAPG